MSSVLAHDALPTSLTQEACTGGSALAEIQHALQPPEAASLCRAWYTNKTVGAKNPDDFFINPTSINYYLANAQNIMTRMNTVTKIAYNQDPTIMAWDLYVPCFPNCVLMHMHVVEPHCVWAVPRLHASSWLSHACLQGSQLWQLR